MDPIEINVGAGEQRRQGGEEVLTACATIFGPIGRLIWRFKWLILFGGPSVAGIYKVVMMITGHFEYVAEMKDALKDCYGK